MPRVVLITQSFLLPRHPDQFRREASRREVRDWAGGGEARKGRQTDRQTDGDCESAELDLCVSLGYGGWGGTSKARTSPLDAHRPVCPQDPDPQPAVPGGAELRVPGHHAPAACRVPGHRRRLEHPAGHLRGQIRGLPHDRCVCFVLGRLTNRAGTSGFLSLALFVYSSSGT